MAGCVAQAVELLTSKAEALNSNPVPSKNKGRGENKQVEKEAIWNLGKEKYIMSINSSMNSFEDKINDIENLYKGMYPEHRAEMKK